MAFESYHQAVRYLESYIRGPSEAPRNREELEAQWRVKLPAMAYLLAKMGDPHCQFPSVHVGGTSGKGSTSTFIAAILRAAGHRAGLHTSPYLQTAVEKVQIDGLPVSPQDFAELVTWARPLFEEVRQTTPYGPLNFVQLWTALAFAYFAQRQIDIGVVEVSLGGRYDYTNVLKPLVTAITTVDFDHMSSLGNTLPDIAWHKAGIVKPGTPVITAVRYPEALTVVQEECQEQGARLYRVGTDITYAIKRLGRSGAVFDFQGMGQAYRDLEVTMLGEHQVVNACVAIGVVEALRPRGFAVSEIALRQGLKEAKIPGRLEMVQTEPLVLLDGAHNPEKARTLARALEALFPDKSLVLVLSIGAAKDALEVLRVLAPRARLVVCTAADVLGKPALPPEELVRQIEALGVEACVVAEPQAALEAALAAADRESLVCVTGSLFLVGAVRERWYPTEQLLTAAAGVPVA